MKQITWRKHHKWLGLLFGFFIFMFCWSGIVLNHRNAVSDININRKWLPTSYHFDAWNSGLLRGSIKFCAKDSSAHLLIYGNCGVWETNPQGTFYKDFNNGLPPGIDYRNVKNIIVTPQKDLLLITPYGLYHHQNNAWTRQYLPAAQDEYLSDITTLGDTIIITGRSHIYISESLKRNFKKIEIQAPIDYDHKVSLFRTVWLIHSGEIMGSAGKLLMDLIALVLIALCITGLIYWILPKFLKKHYSKRASARHYRQWITQSLRWHDGLGRYTIYLLFFTTFTGWCLRPPMLLALVKEKVKAIPGTILSSPNPWNDKLRMTRYDKTSGDWLLSTSEGFYTLKHFKDKPQKIKHTPPVSIMGITVWQEYTDKQWLVGSLSGLYTWNKATGQIKDYFTGEVPTQLEGPPFGKRAISGYSNDFDKPCIVEYAKGTSTPNMPHDFATLPMSLWQLALEVHTGRIYTFLGKGTLIYIFFAGFLTLWCLWSGYKIRKNSKNANHHTTKS